MNFSKILQILIFIFISASGNLLAQDFNFKASEDFDKALEKSAADNKTLLIFTYIGENSRLNEYQTGQFHINSAMADPEVKEYLSQNYVSLWIDLNTDIGKAAANQLGFGEDFSVIGLFHAGTFTRLLAQMSQQSKSVGSLSEFLKEGVELNSWLGDFIDSDQSDMSGQSAQAAFNKIEEAARRGGQISKELVAAHILKELSPNRYFEAGHGQTFEFGFLNDINHLGLQYLLRNQAKFKDVHGEFVWDILLINTTNVLVGKAIEAQDESLLNRVLKELVPQSSQSDNVALNTYLTRGQYYGGIGDQERFDQTIDAMMADDEVSEDGKKRLIISMMQSGESRKSFAPFFESLKVESVVGIVQKAFVLKELYLLENDVESAARVVDEFIEKVKGSNDFRKYDLIERFAETNIPDVKTLEASISILQAVSFNCSQYSGLEAISCAGYADNKKGLIESLQDNLQNAKK
ncbi:MAG: hypothetical protein AAFQ94_05255 [Bacteroidota bacterium]